ncbi:NAD(P)/FAD-dependent oxidoreductase [Ruegeria marina]|uniref:Glycine/D-amino acid oxidase n=1 Tax=Ruegeria marina TaxID=639004 RepID=A0A1G6LEB7_9RHOB|nr:FAD-binding oxidoreductase [Ruegeria marina]SDC41297.1 Glycine/D-amino acid oxidase [Ruegeria marina]
MVKVSENDSNLWHKTCAEQVSAPPLESDTSVDLVIVGGGFTGVSAALHAAQAGASVCLLEAQEIGHGGSGRNVGLANAGLWLPPDDIRAHLGQQAGDRLIALLAGAPARVYDLIARYDIACEPVRNGTLHCAHSAAGLADLRKRHAQLSASGAPVQLLSAEETTRRTGSTVFHGALFDPRAGTIQPLGYVKGLARAAQAAGAKIHARSPVIELSHGDGTWQARTPGGTVRARALIQATNAYHQGLERNAPAYVPVHYFQFATAPLPDALRARILPGGEGCWDTALVMSSFRMDAAGRMIIGAMGDLSHLASGIHRAWVRRKLARLFPELADQPLQMGWHGRIAMTSDHIPKITRPGPNALAAHGYSGRGIGPGTLFGQAMAEALIGGDEGNLPIAAVEGHAERMTGLQQAYYETGATLTHLVRARIGS